MNKNEVKISKFLSLVLRHKPESIGLNLDNQGWADIGELIRCAHKRNQPLTINTIEDVVKNNDKQRFTISEDGKRIRANQGHSIKVDLGLEEKEPPEYLFHGTATRFLDSIKEKGLKSSGRNHVHLSTDYTTAVKVGKRHGKPVIIKVDTADMFKNNYKFYLSENGVWLTESVPPVFFAEFMNVQKK